jgi:Flp pilus assembly protein TadD
MTSRKDPRRSINPPDDLEHLSLPARGNPAMRVRLCAFMAACFFSAVLPSTAQNSGHTADPSVTRQMHEAVTVAQRGDEQQALALVGTLLEQHPDFVPALKLQGMLLEDTGNGHEASLSYEKALKLVPNDPELLLKVGVFQLVKGNTNQAITLLLQRLKTRPKDEESLYYLAQAYHLKGDNDLALKTIQGAIKVDPDSASIWQKYGELLCSSGDNEAALRWLTKAQHSDPTLERINFDLAVASYNNMDLSNAAIYSAKETELQPSDLDAFVLLAATKVKLSQWQDAEAILQHILAVRENDAPSLLALGHCQLELKQFQEAVDTLQRSLQLDPTEVLAHFFLSRALNGLGRVSEAQHEADLHKEMMQQISFTLPKAQLQREKALADQTRQLLSQHREADAVKVFQENYKGLLITPGSPFVFVGVVYLSMGDSENALRTLDHALQIDSKTRDAHTDLGILALQQGDLARAEREFESELVIDPNHPLALAELGEVRYRQGKWSEAADLFVKSKTTIPRLLYLLCDSYFHLGKVPSANLTAESLAAYARNEPEVMRGLEDLLHRNGQSELADRLSHDQHP